MARILLAVGGTGGHVFPAIALAEDLIEKRATVLFAGGDLSKNPFFLQNKFMFKDVACARIKKNPWQWLKALFAIGTGVIDSMKLIREFNPDLILGFGSYYTLPVLTAAKLLRKPIFLHEANSIPGQVNRMFAPYAKQIWVNFPCTQALLKVKSLVGGLPLRPNFRKGFVTKEYARIAFQLDPNRITLLVFGGSQGSKRINQLFSESAIFHLTDLIPSFQVMHFTGSHEDTELLMERYVSKGIPAYIRPFEKRMNLAWAAADIAVIRAGAGSIAELLEFEVPAILIPYPYAADKHQEMNADWLAKRGLALKVDESGLTPQQLGEEIHRLYEHHEEVLNRFRQYKTGNLGVPLAEQIIQWIQQQRVVS